MNDVQSANVQALQANTIPAVAANFAGIANSVQSLKADLQNATVTIDDVYILDASTDQQSATTDFFCGVPGSLMIVSMQFNNLPPGKYALAIVHATGVPHPQQLALILDDTGAGQWMLAGFFDRPMTIDSHDALWYWTHAREYAQGKMDWTAWFYYQLAEQLAQPVEFMSSPNLQKLRHEADDVHPSNLPTGTPVTLPAAGTTFTITGVGTTTALGPLDVNVDYAPSPAQAAQLRDPAAARQQVLDVMQALLSAHPGLRAAFHGMWVHADQGNASIFALELPMDQIVPASGSTPTPATH
jgi:hypothetical protein